MKKDYPLNDTEIFYIEACRNFDFLRRFGYVGESCRGHGVELHIVFTNAAINRSVRIWRESYIFVNIERKKSFGFKRSSGIIDVDSLFDYFGESHLVDLQNNNRGKWGVKEEWIGEILKSYADFIQAHLIPVLVGKKWIDEIADIRKLSHAKFQPWDNAI